MPEATAVQAPVRVEEIMTYAIARELRDGDHGFIGLGTGGRAFINAVGVPSVAMELARRAWGYDIVAQYGVLFEPDLTQTPPSFADPYLLKWPAAAMVPVDICLDVFRRGKMTVSFISGAQIDPFGNLNSVVVGEHDRPKVRLTGPIAQTDHAAYAGRTIIIMPHEPRTFVERVDFISAVGYLDGPGARERLKLPGGGPAMVVTNLGVMRFHPETRRMFLASVHPGVTVEQVLEQTGFPLDHAPDVPTTAQPSADELAVMRQIDPKGLWLEARIR